MSGSCTKVPFTPCRASSARGRRLHGGARLRGKRQAFGSPAFADGDQIVPGAKEEHAVADRGRGHAGLGERMNAGEVELWLRGDDEDVPDLAGEVEMAAIRDGRCGETLTDPRKSFAKKNGARLCVEAGENAEIVAAKEQIVHDDGRLHVITLARLRPGDGGVCLSRVFGSDVARRFRTNGAHRAPVAMRAGEIDEAVSKDRRRDRNVAAAIQRPELSARGKIIACGLMPSIDHELGARLRLDQRGCAPGRHVLSRRAPKLVPIEDVEGGDERILLHIAEHDHFALVNNGRTAKAPLRGGRCVVARVHRAEVLFPEQLSIGIEAKQPLAAKDGHDVPAIRRGRGVAMRGLGVALHFRDGLHGERIPEDFPGGLVEREQTPLLRLIVIRRGNIAIEPDLQLGFLRRHGGRDIDAISRHNGTRMCEPWNRRVPANILAGLDIPRDRQSTRGIDSTRRRTAVLRPVCVRSRSEADQ